MATDATGTPTTKGIPKYNTAVDSPSGAGFNATMDAIDTLLDSCQYTSDTAAANEIVKRNAGNTAWEYGQIAAAQIAVNSVDGTKIALGSDAQGDVMYYDGTNWVRLGAGTSGQFLQTQGAAANPQWADASGGISARQTTLPNNPSDGDQYAYVEDDTNDITWHMRNNGGAAGEWEFLGGSPFYHKVDTAEATGSAGAWVNLTTDGPEIASIQYAGTYLIMAKAAWQHPGGSAFREGHLGVVVGDNTPVDPNIALTQTQQNSAGYHEMTLFTIMTLSAADNLKMRYRSETVNSTFKNRLLCIWPINIDDVGA